MPFLGSTQAWIEVEGAGVIEYGIKTINKETSLSCHVPSEVGKNFIICIRQMEPPPGDHKRMVEVIIDGNRTNKTILHTNATTRISGYRVQKELRRPFVFASLSERSTYHHGNKPCAPDSDLLPLSGLGSIRLLIAMVKLKPKLEDRNRKFQPRAGSTDYLTDEAKLPDISLLGNNLFDIHYTKLDEGVAVKHNGGMTAELATEFPIIQFNFRYAPLDALKSEGITRFTRDLPFSGLPIIDMDFDTGSEVLDEKDKAQYRQLKLEVAARQRLRKLKER